MAAYKRPFYLQLTIYHCMKKIYISKEQIDKIQTLVTEMKKIEHKKRNVLKT